MTVPGAVPGDREAASASLVSGMIPSCAEKLCRQWGVLGRL